MGRPPYRWNIVRGSHRLSFDLPIIGGPMAGAFDPPYRMLLHELGLELSFTEMISSRAVYEGSERTQGLCGWIPEKGHSCAQIFGSDPEYLRYASRKMEEIGHSMIDLNAGCPKRKVTRTGAGSALMKDKDLFIDCVGSILESVSIPVGTKLRSGYSSCDENEFKGLIQDLEGLGISYIALHPRTGKQQYSGKADRKLIEKACKWLDIPVIASGDVRTPDDVSELLDLGACAVMFARGALGDPTWFLRVMDRIDRGNDRDISYPVSSSEVIEHMENLRKHLKSSCSWHGEKRGCIEFRKHLVWYVKKFPGRAAYRERMYSINKETEVLDLITDLQGDWTGIL